MFLPTWLDYIYMRLRLVAWLYFVCTSTKICIFDTGTTPVVYIAWVILLASNSHSAGWHYCTCYIGDRGSQAKPSSDTISGIGNFPSYTLDSFDFFSLHLGVQKSSSTLPSRSTRSWNFPKDWPDLPEEVRFLGKQNPWCENVSGV